MDYNSTINLPKTDFSMRANLPAKEPGILERWNDMQLYEGILAKNEGRPTYILHDGPPYANGDIHMGHALNKCLKDFVVRYKNMSGFNSPYVPGWDTHGLPIESQVIKALGIDRKSVSDFEFRKLCADFATRYIDDQRQQFRRLGVLGTWDNPYLTLSPNFEASQVRVFGEMAKKGYLYKGFKPVYWCAEDETALAEAEIEYQDDNVMTVYVNLPVMDDKGLLFAQTGLDTIHCVIWTTALWTIPASTCVTLGPDIEYGVYEQDGVGYLMATDIAKEVLERGGMPTARQCLTLRGNQLVGVTVGHPTRQDHAEPIVVGDHVTADDGTGCVHSAASAGPEDFEVYMAFKDQFPDMEILRVVDEKGIMTNASGPFAGLGVWDANNAIHHYLAEQGTLFASRRFTHAYPHCWRCHSPVLFRLTEQWFCSVDDFRDQTMRAIANVKWYPAWGEERMASMVRERSDWCVSRQRLWGVPIPIFYCASCGRHIIDDASIEAVATLFEREGSNGWYAHSAGEILPEGYACSCGGTSFTKETDIMDVWFDSGSSHFGVLESRPELRWPADMYLEGSDQHRGWFQSSLLTAVAVRGEAPYRECVTCGMVVDGEGKKMSKSLGNGVEPSEVEAQYGADIIRLWAAATDSSGDVRLSPDILKQHAETYRKIRNTARYLLGNLDNFDPNVDPLPFNQLQELDRWALTALERMLQKALAHYEVYSYYNVFNTIHNFCVVDMSSFYFDILKDRLYCEDKTGSARRSAQTALYTILRTLTLLLAPILSFTAEEIWQHMAHHKDDRADSVNYNDIPKTVLKTEKTLVDDARWATLLALREDVKKALESARADKLIGAALEAVVTIFCTDADLSRQLTDSRALLESLLISSQVKVVQGDGEGLPGEALKGVSIAVSVAQGEKCERCWRVLPTVGSDSSHPTLCPRCADVVKSLRP